MKNNKKICRNNSMGAARDDTVQHHKPAGMAEGDNFRARKVATSQGGQLAGGGCVYSREPFTFQMQPSE